MKIRIKKNHLKFSFILVAILLALGALNYSNTLIKNHTPASKIKELSPNYYEYSDKSLKLSQSRGKTILFFAATTWCNTCSNLDKEIKEKSMDLPKNITILKTDYDNDKALNKKYFITIQHTLVVLDKNGEEIKRWIGGNFEELIKNI